MNEVSNKLRTTCIETTYLRNAGGYGRASNPEKVPRMVLHHRLAYAKAAGVTLKSIEHLLVRHKCDNPACINPDHLELGTHKDNYEDMMARKRRAPHSIGEDHGLSKFTEADIIFIRSKHLLSTMQLCKKFNVAKSTIDNILSLRTWKHI